MKATAFGILMCLISLYLMMGGGVFYGIGMYLFIPSAVIALIGLLTKWDKNKEE